MTVVTRKSVHDGISAWFGGTYQPEFRCWQHGPLVRSGLGTVRKAFPKKLNDADFTAGMESGRGMGAFMVVDLPADTEHRGKGSSGSGAIAGAPVLDGAGNIIGGGIKVIDYKVALQVFHMAQVDYTEDAVDDVDQLIEAIKQHIRVDRTLGGICTQAGESRFGIQTSVGKPGLDEKLRRTGIWSQIQFEVMVQIVA